MTAKLIVLSLVGGLLFVFGLMIVANAGAFPEVTSALLSPALTVASFLGIGSHDIGILVAALLFDGLLYGAGSSGHQRALWLAHLGWRLR